MADEALDKLQIDIMASSSSAAEGINKLAEAVRNLRSAVGRNGANLSGLAKTLESINTAVSGVNTDKIGGAASAIESLGKAMSTVQSASSQVHEATRAFDELSGATESISEFTDAFSEMERKMSNGLSGQATGQSKVTESMREAGEAMKESADEAETAHKRAAQGAATSWRSASARVTAAFNAVKRVAGAFGKSILKTITLPLQEAGKVAIAAASKMKDLIVKGIMMPFRSMGNLFGKITTFLKSIGRIALYRMIRSAIKALTQGLQEGIQNLYQWSLVVDRTFANSMDSIASSMLYMRNGFAAMFSPLINYAAPIIEEVTNRIVEMFNVVQQVFAALTGAKTWTRAVRVQKQYAEAVTDTGKAAEKAMHQLMAFDELNVITTPSDSGNSGSGANTPPYSSMFTTETVNSELVGWVEDIKRFFESGDFYGLGSYVGEKLNDLVDQWNAYGDGFNLGTKIRHALEALNGFLETFDFYNLGAKVGDWIGGMMDGITPEEIATTITNLFNSAVSGANGLADKLIEHGIPQKIGQALGTAIANFDWAGLVNLGRKILTGIVTMVNSAMSNFISNGGPQKLIDAAGEIGKAIGEAFAMVNWGDVVTIATSIFTGLVNMFSGAISSFVDNGGPEKLKSGLAQIGTAIGEAFANIRGKDLAAIINAIAGGILEMFKNGINAFSKGGGWKEIGNLIKELDWGTLFTIGGIVATLSIAKTIIKGLTEAVIKTAIMNAISGGAVGGVAGTSATLGGITMTAAGLVIPMLIMGSVVLAESSGLTEPLHKMFGDALSEAAKESGVLDTKSTRFGTGKTIMEYGNAMFWDTAATDAINGLTEALGSISRGGGGGGKLQNRMVKNSISVPLKLDESDIIRKLNNSEVPKLAERLANDSVSRINGAVKQGNIPKTFGDEATRSITEFGNKDFAGAGTRSVTAIKNTVTGIASKFGVEGQNSINEFLSKDFTGGGRSAGSSLINGLNGAGFVGTMAALTQNALNAFLGANWAGVGASGGTTLGQHFKSAFASHAKSTLMLQTAAGKPITQAYVVPYASGGFVQGGLFLAGEIPGQAEMVGSINGRTGVASGAEITGIGDAVRATGAEEAALLRQQNQLLQALLAKDPFGTPNSAAGRWIAQSSQAYKAVTG